ncbi:MAG TPA: hypothetical protein VKT28_22675 [Puia sp.]|nr:hypothetical protein [Puia sp.]
MIIKFFIIFCSLSILSKTCVCQDKKDTVYLKNLPVKDGIIIRYESLFGDPGNGMDIYSTHDSVFHFAEGKVSSIFTIEGAKVVLIKNHDGYFISYTGLKNSFLNKGDSISEGTFIGALEKNEEGNFELQLIILSPKYPDDNSDYTIKVLEKYHLIKQITKHQTR